METSRVRLSRDERMQQIVNGATAFFAEHGIGGQTRDLAATLGVTHALLYRYFPSKQALIERVYHEVFLGRWSNEWESLLADPALSFGERVKAFYSSYARMILNKEAVRIFVSSGLNRSTIPQRFLKRIERRIFLPLMRGLREELGLPPFSERPVTQTERELIWHLHGSIFYIGIRHWIYDLPLPDDLASAVELRCTAYLLSAPVMVREAVTARHPARPAKRVRERPD
jgi:AcrR family transcriptional regulator